MRSKFPLRGNKKYIKRCLVRKKSSDLQVAPINVGGPTWNKLSDSDKQKSLNGGFPKVSPGKSSKISPTKRPEKSKPTRGYRFVYVLIVTDLDPETSLIVFPNRRLLEEYIQDPRRGRMPVKMMNDALQQLYAEEDNTPGKYSVKLADYRIFKAPIIDSYPNFDFNGFNPGLPVIPIL